MPKASVSPSDGRQAKGLAEGTATDPEEVLADRSPRASSGAQEGSRRRLRDVDLGADDPEVARGKSSATKPPDAACVEDESPAKPSSWEIS